MVRIGLFGMFSKMYTYIEICDHVLISPEWSLEKKAQTVPLARTPWPGFCYHSLLSACFSQMVVPQISQLPAIYFVLK